MTSNTKNFLDSIKQAKQDRQNQLKIEKSAILIQSVIRKKKAQNILYLESFSNLSNNYSSKNLIHYIKTINLLQKWSYSKLKNLPSLSKENILFWNGIVAKVNKNPLDDHKYSPRLGRLLCRFIYSYSDLDYFINASNSSTLTLWVLVIYRCFTPELWGKNAAKTKTEKEKLQQKASNIPSQGHLGPNFPGYNPLLDKNISDDVAHTFYKILLNIFIKSDKFTSLSKPILLAVIKLNLKVLPESFSLFFKIPTITLNPTISKLILDQELGRLIRMVQAACLLKRCSSEELLFIFANLISILNKKPQLFTYVDEKRSEAAAAKQKLNCQNSDENQSSGLENKSSTAMLQEPAPTNRASEASIITILTVISFKMHKKKVSAMIPGHSYIHPILGTYPDKVIFTTECYDKVAGQIRSMGHPTFLQSSLNPVLIVAESLPEVTEEIYKSSGSSGINFNKFKSIFSEMKISSNKFNNFNITSSSSSTSATTGNSNDNSNNNKDAKDSKDSTKEKDTSSNLASSAIKSTYIDNAFSICYLYSTLIYVVDNSISNDVLVGFSCVPKIIDRLWKFINGIRLETFTNTIDFTKEMNDDQLQQTRSLAGIITLFCLVARVYIGVASDETLYSMKTPMLPDQALSPQSIAAASVFFNKLIFNCLYWGLGLEKNILLFKYLQN